MKMCRLIILWEIIFEQYKVLLISFFSSEIPRLVLMLKFKGDVFG